MTSWLVIPRDPLIFRDGRPFTAAPGSRARSLGFPYPSTLAGAVRTLAGIDASSGRFIKDKVAELILKSIRGPVLVSLNQDGSVSDWYFPSPADALLVKSKSINQASRFALAPLRMPERVSANLAGLSLVGPSKTVQEKAHPYPPYFWRWEQYKSWLESPTDDSVSIGELGIRNLPQESRTHVSIVPETLAALEGALFQTNGLEFIQTKPEKAKTPKLSEAQALALVVETDAEFEEGYGFLGGERRVVYWEKAPIELKECPDGVKKSILSQGHCRLILVTPACFESGYLPNWLQSQYGIEIVAAAIKRYQPISGWDYAINQPKPTRRLVPAGSVFFLKLKDDPSARERLVKEIWMNTVSDGEQDRHDGFGLAVFGTWDGKLRKMEVES